MCVVMTQVPSALSEDDRKVEIKEEIFEEDIDVSIGIKHFCENLASWEKKEGTTITDTEGTRTEHDHGMNVAKRRSLDSTVSTIAPLPSSYPVKGRQNGIDHQN
ncbi:2-dehydropantoate 2-reductase [Frankliniella fusca]|uniref:2-dehydropantoate 2-reductase n=1 Tax=Frankliniella fusca TaxID=407009 RepID=A0AAE1HXP7_9NEOP|nr:2-dehydropantoate 2-reductase [Frankliniella fusca]